MVRNSFDCYDTVRKTVEIYAMPAASFGIGRECSGSAQKIIFTDLSTITSPDFIPSNGYGWDFGGAGTSKAKDTAIVFPSSQIYTVTHSVTSSHNCLSVHSNTVNITPRPVARFIYSNNSIPGLGAFVEFNDTSLYAEGWHWEFGNGDTSNEQDPTAYYSTNGIYTVTLTVTDAFGCPSTFTSVVTVNTIVSEITELIPNMITPNNDGKNDLWRLDFIQVYYPQAVIEVYNVWGMRLFRSEGYSNAWDGTYKGDPLPVGTYFYTIQLNDINNTPVYKGTLTLLK